MVEENVNHKLGKPKNSGNRINKAKENNSSRIPGSLFEKGNPPRSPGRPKGSRSKSTVVLEAIGLENAAAIYQRVVDLALGITKEGDRDSCKIILDRVFPVPRGRKHDLKYYGSIDTIQDINDLSKHILNMVISGKLSAEEAEDHSREIERRIKVITDSSVMDRINTTCQKIDDLKNGM